MHKIYLNTGRNCLIFIIRAYGIKEIYIPYYYCPSVRLAISKENCKIKFYHIDKNFKCIEKLPKEAYIVYPDYFGICAKNVYEMSNEYNNLIIDNAHAFFAKPTGAACFTSLRKFFPSLRDGAVLYTKKLCNEIFEKDTFEYEQKNLTYEELCANEKRLDFMPIRTVSDCTLDYFKNINFEEEKQKYINNFKFWHNKIGDKNRLCTDITESDVPFGYTYLASNEEEADVLVKKLNLSGYNIFRYWNNMPDSYEEKVFYTNLVVIRPKAIIPRAEYI